MHIDMIHFPEFNSYDVSSLRLATTAGAICPEELIKLMKEKYTVDGVVVRYTTVF
jgi:acyl-coenzyme A synthetase/AMP-(fatty) acid ligase